jgi:hypothetical protein
VILSPPVHAGEPESNQFDGYPQPSEWDAVVDYLEKIGAAEDAIEPPASPVEAPAAPGGAPDAPAVLPSADAVAAPATVQLPNTGGGIERAVMPVAAIVAAFLGALLVGVGRSVRTGVKAT